MKKMKKIFAFTLAAVLALLLVVAAPNLFPSELSDAVSVAGAEDSGEAGIEGLAADTPVILTENVLSPADADPDSPNESERETAISLMDGRGIAGDAGSVDFEILFNHDDIPKFVLCVSSEGYLIMDRDTHAVLENGQGAGPYAEYPDAKKYYGGLWCCVVETDEGLYDIIYNRIVETVPYIEAVDELGDPAVPGQETEAGIEPLSASLPVATVSKRLKTTIVDIAKISFGHNTDNTCTAVACGLALNYLDKTLDNNIVPNAMEAEDLVPDNDGWDSAAYPKTAALHNYLVDDCGMGPMTYADGVGYGLWMKSTATNLPWSRQPCHRSRDQRRWPGA